jgi:PKD repeat protein
LTVNFISTVIGRISGEKVAYKWDFGDETTSEEANPTHTFNSAGTYTVTCTVTGGTPSQTAGDTIEINVAPTWPAAVCTADGDQSSPQIATDGSGGAIIGWQDQRSGNNWDIYAGRISSTGELLWTADGVAICTEEHQQEYLQITIDGSGGAIITWMDKRSGDYWDIYIQRIDSTGKPIWATDGVAVCTAAYNQESPRITTDGSGGAIITWQDYRKGNRDIYTQRIDSTGKPVWTTDGVAISTAYSHQSNPQIISDGSGGAIITWQDYRSDIEDIYAARISSTGELPWTADGVPICIAAGFQVNPQITTDGSGGAIITWQDQRSGNHDIYARRIAGNGGLMWTSDGVPICTAANDQRYPQIAPDGSGGAIFTWQDARVNQYGDIYAQRMDSTGKPLWTANGVPICTQSGAKQPPRITYNGSGGSFITWPDSRGSGWVIYAQLVSDDGKVQWMENGAALTGNNVSYHTLQIISDGSDGAIIVWGEYSDKENYDIYARRISKEVKVK